LYFDYDTLSVPKRGADPLALAYRRLAAAVVLQAYRDLNYGGNLAEQAAAWLGSDGARYYAECLGLDAGALAQPRGRGTNGKQRGF